MKSSTVRLLLIAGALILSVLLFIAPRNLPEKEPVAETSNSGSSTEADIAVYESMAAKNLAPEIKAEHDSLKQAGEFDSLTVFWDTKKRPDLGAYFAELAAGKGKKAEHWFNAGNRYYYSVQFSNDRNEIPVLYQSAMRCFRKGLALESGNTDARIMLASCYVEGTDNPMDGITMLREIEKKDSMNVKLQLSFAAFSMKSGQLGKAIERFRKALRADSTYIEAYLHLADAYEQTGDAGSTIMMLESFAARTTDPAARTEVKKYIEQIKTKQ
jgi:tetratricopeptide (TPR) repeat protein